MRQFLRQRRARGQFTTIGASVTIGRNTRLGTWSIIGSGAGIGDNVKFGDWACVGVGAVVGNNVTLGDHVKIGAGAVIGDGVVLPGHARVQPGVHISKGESFDGGDLITPSGIIPGRCGGFMTSQDMQGEEPVLISGRFGRFVVPADKFDNKLIEDFMWGRSEELDLYRVNTPTADLEGEPDPSPEDDFTPQM